MGWGNTRGEGVLLTSMHVGSGDRELTFRSRMIGFGILFTRVRCGRGRCRIILWVIVIYCRGQGEAYRLFDVMVLLSVGMFGES